MKVKILKTDKSLGIKEGEIYYAQRYQYEPLTKVTLLSRVGDNYEPMCNQYVNEVEFILD